MREVSLAERFRGRARAGAGLVAGAILLVGARAALPVASPAARPAAPDPVVAQVDGKPIKLSEAQEFQRRNMERYKQETGKAAPASYDSFFLRIGLEEVVRQRLVELDARARGMTVSDAQAESLMKLDPFFQTAGKFDAARFANYRTANPKSFGEARDQARALVLFQRRMQQVQSTLEPTAAELDGYARARDLKAKVRYVLVSDLHYDGEHDPTDDELRAYYAANQDQIARQAEFAFTAITVPFAADANRSLVKPRADSLLAAALAGASFDSLLRAPGVVGSSGVWRPGATEGLFAASPRVAQAALDRPANSIVPQLVEAKDGYAIVRVDRTQARFVPPLSQVAVDLRARWRAQKIQAEETDAARRYYEAHPDSFVTRAWQVRWAYVDSSKASPRSPKEADLTAWYEGHRAEFARLDPSGGGVQTRPYDEVKDLVALKWRAEDRAREARRIADELATAWGRGQAGSATRASTLLGPAWIVEGGALPDDLPREFADSARARDRAPQALVLQDPRGFAVVGVARYEPRYRAEFDVVAPHARDLAFNERIAQERAGARGWYDAHPELYRTGPGYEIAYVTSPPVPTVQIDVPAEKIRQYYDTHRSELGTPPEIHVRHILVMTDRRSDADARAIATRALARVRAGEDFAAVARELSEDPGSKDSGGDLGFIGRGTTVPPFDRAAFALTPAQPLSNLVRSQFGYHVIQLIERRDAKIPSFEEVRADLGQKIATEYSDSLARKIATDLQRTAKNRDDLLTRADAQQLGSQLVTWYEGQPLIGPTTMDDLRSDLPNAHAGGILPRVYRYLATGYVVAAVDTILPPRQLSFEEVQDRALSDQRRDAGRRAARDRAGRLSKDLAAGVPWERAVETVGGETTTPEFGRGVGLPTLGPVAGLDSLLFGPGADTLEVGSWARLPTPRGELFVQLMDRNLPASSQTRAAHEQLRATVLNRRLYDYVEGLRARWPVEVLRPDLAERVPPPPSI